MRALLISLAAIAALAGPTVAAQARQGADDPPAHNTRDDRGHDGATAQAARHVVKHRIRARGHRADDPAGHDAGDDNGTR